MKKQELKATAISVGIVFGAVLAIIYAIDIYNISRGLDEESALQSDLYRIGLNTHELERTAYYQDDTGLTVVYCSDSGYSITKFYKKAVLSSNLYLVRYEVHNIEVDLVGA
jgi:hypothetical protein